MKKVTFISDKIKNNTFSYTGKGGFEAVANNYSEDILSWLEKLIPLQQQIDMLYEKENIEFQKRNYTRIVTKFFPKEYKEFVNINILLRDANAIKDGFTQQQDITNLYNLLVTNNYLKYPGRSEIYVDFDTFEEFILVYKDELDIQYVAQYKKKEDAISLKEKEKKIVLEEKINEDTLIENKEDKKEENYWTNLLLGKR
jgi:hypothetical protein